MWTASSAKRTTAESLSAVEYTATVWMPISRQVRATRRAISPRLAISTVLNMALSLVHGRQDEQPLVVLDRRPVGHQDLGDPAAPVGLDRVHQLHRLENPDLLAGFHDGALAHERRLAGPGGTVEGAD